MWKKNGITEKYLADTIKITIFAMGIKNIFIMNTATTSQALTQVYCYMLANLSDKIKVALAKRLLDSVNFDGMATTDKAEADKKTQAMLDKFAGCWTDERSSDEIIASIREARSSIREPLKL